jgi:hypothetical protein
MPTVSNTNLMLTTVNNTVTVNVTYDATFTPFERQLAGLGMDFFEHIDVIGIDPPGSTTGAVLANFPNPPYAVTVGSGAQVISRNVSLPLSRSSLQEDPTVGGVADDDEIRCKIRIKSKGLPPEFTPDEFTLQRVLLG